MSNLDVPGVLKKLSGMARRFDTLKRYENISLEDYLLNEDVQIITERLLELIIQAAIDINKMFLKQLVNVRFVPDSGQPLTNAETFRLMAAHEFIPSNLAEVLARSGQFRNVLAHFYDDIDSRQVYDALQITLDYYPDYIEAIQDHIDSLFHDLEVNP
ncbi:MAG: DUF86 domain-containing protein [Spirulina sp.]